MDLNQLGFSDLDFAEGELPDGAVLLVRVHLDNGETALRVRYSAGTDWLVRRGMLEAALDGERTTTIEAS